MNFLPISIGIVICILTILFTWLIVRYFIKRKVRKIINDASLNSAVFNEKTNTNEDIKIIKDDNKTSRKRKSSLEQSS